MKYQALRLTLAVALLPCSLAAELNEKRTIAPEVTAFSNFIAKRLAWAQEHSKDTDVVFSSAILNAIHRPFSELSAHSHLKQCAMIFLRSARAITDFAAKHPKQLPWYTCTLSNIPTENALFVAALPVSKKLALTILAAIISVGLPLKYIIYFVTLAHKESPNGEVIDDDRARSMFALQLATWHKEATKMWLKNNTAAWL